MVKKIDRRKLLGEVLAKQIAAKDLETYREGYQYPPIHHQQKYNMDKIAKALETYRESTLPMDYQYPPIHHQQKYNMDKIARTKTNQPNQLGLPAKQRNSTLQKPDIKLLKNPIPNYNIFFSKNFFLNEEPIKKPDLNVKEDPDLQNGLGSLLRVKD